MSAVDSQPREDYMNETYNGAASVAARTRRQWIGGVGIAIGSAAIAWPKNAQESVNERASTGANKRPTSLHLDMEVKLRPARVYQVLLDEKQFAACTGLPAEIDPKVGGAFTLFKGQIVGRNIELIACRSGVASRPLGAGHLFDCPV
jgi:hypothetical protein